MLETIFDGTVYRFFNHLYAVSICGKVLRKLSPYQPIIRNERYISVGDTQLHRMVAHCWCANPNGASQVHHINHDRSDNNASNLEWLTPKLHKAHHRPTATMKITLRDLRTGSVTSEATKQKQREAAIRLGCRPPPPIAGVKRSPESIAKMSANSPNAMQCEINGILYKSFSEAGRALSEKPHSLRKRCLSKNFPGYKVRE